MVLRGLLRGCGIRTKLIIAARCESVCSLHELQKGMSLLGKRHALHHVRAWSFGLSSQDSSRLLVSCVSYRFFPRFFFGSRFLRFFANFDLIACDFGNQQCSSSFVCVCLCVCAGLCVVFPLFVLRVMCAARGDFVARDFMLCARIAAFLLRKQFLIWLKIPVFASPFWLKNNLN